MDEDGKEEEGTSAHRDGVSSGVQSIIENLAASYKSWDLCDTLATESKDLTNIITKFGVSFLSVCPGCIFVCWSAPMEFDV